MVADRIKALRESSGMTQTAVGTALGISRAAVNAWEMGISVPSTQYVAQLAELFAVSSDYLLGLENTAAVSVAGLSEEEVAAVVKLIACLRKRGKEVPSL